MNHFLYLFSQEDVCGEISSTEKPKKWKKITTETQRTQESFRLDGGHRGRRGRFQTCPLIMFQTCSHTQVLCLSNLNYLTPNSLSILSNGAMKNGGIVQIHTHTKKFVYPNVSCIYPAIIPGIIIPSAIKPVQIA